MLHTNWYLSGRFSRAVLLSWQLHYFFPFVYCSMLFIATSLTFQTKIVTRNRYTKLERRCGRVSVTWPFQKAPPTNNFDPFPQRCLSSTQRTRLNPITKLPQDYYSSSGSSSNSSRGILLIPVIISIIHT